MDLPTTSACTYGMVLEETGADDSLLKEVPSGTVINPSLISYQ